MNDSPLVVTGGVDSHADTHVAAALDPRGVLLGTRSFPTTSSGYRELLAWLEGFGRLELVGVESTGSYAAGLTRFLSSRTVTIVEVNQPHAHTRRRKGKSDPIDAEAAARAALSGNATAIPKRTSGIVESIRQLRVARDSAIKSRSAAMIQLSQLLITSPQELRDQLSTRKTVRGKVSVCARLRADARRLEEPVHAARFALRSLAKRVVTLGQEIAALDKQLAPLVASAAPSTTQLLAKLRS